MSSDLLDIIPNWELSQNKYKKREIPQTDFVLVLDLDETAIKTFRDLAQLEKLGIFTRDDLLELRLRTYKFTIYDPEGKTYKNDVWGVTRPHLRGFLQFSQVYFKYIFVWSSGIPRYVNQISDLIFRDLQPPTGILTQKDCPSDEKGRFFKPLSQIVAKYPRLDLDISKMIMLDDLKVNMSRNPKSGIMMSKYNPVPPVEKGKRTAVPTIESLSKDDNTFLVIEEWLLSPMVLHADDIREIEKPVFVAEVEEDDEE